MRLNYDAIAEAISPEQLAQAIGSGKGQNGKYRCPRGDLHNNGDQNPSLSISRKNDRVVCHCFGCGLSGSPVQVVAEIWGVDLSVAARRLCEHCGIQTVSQAGGTSARRIVARYVYFDESNEPLFRKIRTEPKAFWIEHRENDCWVKGGPPRWILYRLPELLNEPERLVLVVEGEKDADWLSREGFLSTTNPCGAAEWRPEFTKALRGRKVAIIPDNDGAGRRRAAIVARKLVDANCLVRVIELTNLGEKGDVSDWLEAGHTAAHLRELIRSKSTPLTVETLGELERRWNVANAVATQDVLDDHKSIQNLVADAGLNDLNEESTEEEIEAAMRRLVKSVEGADNLRRTAIEQTAHRLLSGRGVKAAGKWAKSALTSHRSNSKDDKQQGQCIIPKDPDLWPDPVDGSELLDEIVEILNRFLVLPEGATETMALWVLFTYVLDAGQISPYLAFESPEKRCGKTLALEIMDILVLRPLNSSNATAAAMFRTIEAHRPTLLLDEVETFIGDPTSDLTGILNAGHRRSKAAILRTVGENHEPRSFSVWAAKSFALIGKLPATLQDRSLVIRMKRRTRDESVERFRYDHMEPECRVFKRKAFRWAKDNFNSLVDADPDLPESLNDREADNWRPLFAIATMAGGDWPARARRAAVILSGAVNEVQDSVGIQILEDIKDLFAQVAKEKLSSEEIVFELAKMEDRPWGEWKLGKPITKPQLARLVKRYEITPKTIKLENNKTLKGYTLSQFLDAFSRYIPPQLVTASPPCNDTGLSPISKRNHTSKVTGSKSSETGVGTELLRGYELEAGKTEIHTCEGEKSDDEKITPEVH